MTLGRPLEPDASRARFPLLRSLGLFIHSRVQLARAHINNDLVLISELLLLLALDVDIGPGDPAGAEIQVLFDAVPQVLVELAAGNGIQGGTCLNGDIGDDETFVVEGEVAVDGLGEDAVAVIEEEYKEEDNESQQPKLDARTDLQKGSECEATGGWS